MNVFWFRRSTRAKATRNAAWRTTPRIARTIWPLVRLNNYSFLLQALASRGAAPRYPTGGQRVKVFHVFFFASAVRGILHIGGVLVEKRPPPRAQPIKYGSGGGPLDGATPKSLPVVVDGFVFAVPSKRRGTGNPAWQATPTRDGIGSSVSMSKIMSISAMWVSLPVMLGEELRNSARHCVISFTSGRPLADLAYVRGRDREFEIEEGVPMTKYKKSRHECLHVHMALFHHG